MTAVEGQTAKSGDAAGATGDSVDSADLAPPPSTFFQAIQQAATAVQEALDAGETLVEVEFPPLPAAQLESSAVGAYDVLDANIRLAVDFAKILSERDNVAIQFPDFEEKDRAVELNGESDTPAPGVRFGMLKAYSGNLLERLMAPRKEEVAIQKDDDILVVIGASAQELPDVEALVAQAKELGKPVILFNLKLDSARGDLGLPAFPRKALHYRFLSTILPVYYLRTRSYTRSLKKPPYTVNYSGALYRVYPGPYQVLLDTSSGRYERLATRETRPALGEVRDTLTEGLDIDVPFKQFLGVSTTWWEAEDGLSKQSSDKWRS